METPFQRRNCPLCTADLLRNSPVVYHSNDLSHSIGFGAPKFIIIFKSCHRARVSGQGPRTAVQSQKAVSAYFTSKQILPFHFAKQNWYHVVWKPWLTSATNNRISIEVNQSNWLWWVLINKRAIVWRTQNISITLHNVGPTSKTLGRRCINVIQMFFYFAGSLVQIVLEFDDHKMTVISRMVAQCDSTFNQGRDA